MALALMVMDSDVGGYGFYRYAGLLAYLSQCGPSATDAPENTFIIASACQAQTEEDNVADMQRTRVVGQIIARLVSERERAGSMSDTREEGSGSHRVSNMEPTAVGEF